MSTATDYYEAGYAEGFHHGRSTPLEVDWRVLCGLIPGPIPVEWVRVGDTIQDHGQITRITKHFREVQLFLDDGYVSIVKKTQQDFICVTGTKHENVSVK